MKIAVITSGFLPVPPSKGGAVENLLYNLIKENEVNEKFEFEIFSIYNEEASKIAKEYKKTKFQFIKTNKVIEFCDLLIFYFAKNILKKENSQSYRFIFQRLFYLKKVSKALKLYNYDKILLENHPTQYLALKWKKNYKKYDGRYYYHCHNEFPGTYGCNAIIQKTKKILCVSEFISKKIQKNLNIEKDKIYVLKNGVDTKKFEHIFDDQEIVDLKRKLKIEPNDKVLLFTGRLIPQKGVKELLLSIQNLSQKYKLLILGAALNDLKVETKYEKDIKELINHNKNVIFTGFISYEEIWKFYKIADIAVLPSIWDDPAPLTIIEATIAGLPIITTDSGGIPEYVNTKCAIILDRNKDLINQLAINIDKLLGNNELRRKMGEESIKISQNRNVENYYKNFVKGMELNEE